MTATPVLSIEDPQAIPTAGKILANHGLVVFPTDTVYGVAAQVTSPPGIRSIYAAKERPEEKALPILIGEITQLDPLILSTTKTVRQITRAFWPGPLTLILPKSAAVPLELSPYPTVGIRMPGLPFTLSLLKHTGPLATTSANLSGGPNPTTVAEVLEQLDGRVDLILDGGSTPGPTPSTVVDASGQTLNILREGPITLAELLAVTSEG
jgi:L-threonylcarbamoyladenylate synthase